MAADARALAEAKAGQDAAIAATNAAKAIKLAVTLYSFSSKSKLSTYDTAYLIKYVKSLKNGASVTCIGYSHIVEKMVRKTFLAVQNHDYQEVLNGVSSNNLTHRFAGPNSLGGIRHDKEALGRWFERVGTVLPELKFDVTNVLVHGGPWKTIVVARWVATCKLENGDSYMNPGIHVIKLRWGKAYDFDVYEDTFAVTVGLEKQAESGIAEALDPQIVN